MRAKREEILVACVVVGVSPFIVRRSSSILHGALVVHLSVFAVVFVVILVLLILLSTFFFCLLPLNLLLQDAIPKNLLQLLINTPPQAAAIRKELLIATRHVLTTEFRTGFISSIDTLLDEKVLVGHGLTCRETLRPLAYSTIADFVHAVQKALPLPSLKRVVVTYAQVRRMLLFCRFFFFSFVI
jgi:hypothetical protein